MGNVLGDLLYELTVEKKIPLRGAQAAVHVLQSIFKLALDGHPIEPKLVSLQDILGDVRHRFEETAPIEPFYVLDGINVAEANGYVEKKLGVYTITQKALNLFRKFQSA